MTNKTFTFFLFFLTISIFTFGQKSKLSVSEPVMIDNTYNLFEAGDVFLAGQPTQEKLDSLLNAGVSLVVNLRTAGEMEMLPFKEEDYLNSKGIRYVHIPLGGEDGYPPEAIEKMGKAMQSAEGKVLVHCRSAGRATYAWMAWLIRYQGYPIDKAVEFGNKARFSVPFFELLGYPVTIQQKE